MKSPTSRRQAAWQTAICTLALTSISASVSTIVYATHGGPFTFAQGMAALAGLAAGSWLVYVGHCRTMLG